MGVKGLWELLHPVARPIKLENLSNKHLAIDASIWLHQFLRGMRDKEGQVIGNAHLIGFFRRICKLLYYNVKPIFVFDGGTPALKRLTIQERRRRKKQDANMVKRTAEKLLAAQLRLRALEQRKAARKKKEQEKQDMANNVVHDSADNPTYLGEIKDDDAISAGKSNNETGLGSQAKRTKDRYLLPPMEVDFDTLSKLRSHDERFGYQAEDDVSKFMNEFKTEAGVANIDSDVFKALPSEVQYEILHDIRLRSRVTSYDRVQEMVRLSNTPMDFSKLQVQGVIRRNNATHKLLTVNQAVSKMDEVTKPGRIASQRNRQYVLVKNEEGGWVLGGKKPETGATPDKPVQLDSDEDEAKIKDGVKEELEEDWVSDDEDGDVELEEVKIPQISLGPTLASHDTSRFNTESKTTTIRPIAPKAAVKADDSNSLINHLEAYMDENESIESVMAKFAEIEDEAVRKRDMDDGERTNEMNGLHLIREQDVIQVKDGARQHLAKAGLRLKNDAQWPEVISDGDELDSIETLPSDITLDYEDFEDMVEDEETGEILSLQAYNRRRNLPGTPGESSGRALSTAEESRLERDAFHSYWTGYTPDCFKLKYQEYEWMIREAIYDWEYDRIEAEIHSATRKREKSSVNDTVGVEALEFWISFLESVLNRRMAQSEKKSEDSAGTKRDAPQAHKGLTTERKSRLSQSILLDDDDDYLDNDIDVDEIIVDNSQLKQRGPKLPDSLLTSDKSSISSSEPPEAMLTVNEAPKSEDSKTPRRPILDFSSSILKRWTPSSAPEQTSVEMSTETILSLALESTVKSTQEVADDGIDLTTVIDETASDSGVGSLTSSPGPDLEAAVVPSLDKDGEKATNDMSLAEEGIMADEKELEALTKDIAEAKAEVTLEDGDDEEEEADLVNEEQDFTNLFPDMASLPGAILNPREPLPPPETQETRPVLSAEDKAALEKQDARKMFEESKQLESEIRALQDQHRKHQRDADDLTESMVAETKMLLRLFGIPYLVAPMEAEAQCADLQLRGVVDGILTEDSDVFLFGGARVFKNMFKEEKYVECYLMSDVERDLGVGRDRLVALAYLLGSDYTAGVKGIGLITAMEIIRLFPKLENFARWWRGEQHKVDGADDVDGKYNEKGLTELELDSMDEVALEKLAKQCKKIHIPSSFPDPHIAEAYIRPIVDDDPAKFQWGIPDLDGLRDFLRKSLGWDRGEVDRALLPIIRQMSSVQQPTQTTLDSFFDNSVGMGSFQLPMKTTLLKSARLRKAVDGLTGRSPSKANTGSDADSGDKKKTSKAATKKAPAKRKHVAKKGKDATEEREAKESGGNRDGEDDNEEGFVDELEKKKQKTKVATFKKAKTAQTRVPEAVTAAKQQLKSKNVEAKLAERNKSRAAAAAIAVANDVSCPSSQSIGRKRSNQRSECSSSSSSSGSDDNDENDDDRDDFSKSHWDLLAEKQRQSQENQQQVQPPKKGGLTASNTPAACVVSGVASSLTALVSASNAARYGSSFRNKETGRAKKAAPASPAKKSRRSQ
ncbi:DNA repair protein rad2 [Dissophora ornata]|nr:DNA repair protein rad2 [Dissophora ornata]